MVVTGHVFPGDAWRLCGVGRPVRGAAARGATARNVTEATRLWHGSGRGWSPPSPSAAIRGGEGWRSCR